MTVSNDSKRRLPIPLLIAALCVLVLGAGGFMVEHAESKTNTVALSATPKPVSAVRALAAQYRPSRAYVGTIRPWIEAKIGPQFVSAYVSDVLVRPGALVKKGDVLARLDCRNASATSEAVSMQARALEAQEQALAHESQRIQNMLKGGYVSPNEAEQKLAQSSSQKANLLATRAQVFRSTLEVNDCVLRAPFDAEVATRSVDPGAFVRPGSPIVSIVDRRTVRIGADVPEVDFDVVKPDTKVRVHVLATGRDLTGAIARRAPAADDGTRTVHFEMDVSDPERSIPVGTTAELQIDVGDPTSATQIPLAAAAVRGEKASVFVAENGIAHARTLRVKGESNGQLYLDTALAPGSEVIVEGRALLVDGDAIALNQEPEATSTARKGG